MANKGRVWGVTCVLVLTGCAHPHGLDTDGTTSEQRDAYAALQHCRDVQRQIAMQKIGVPPPPPLIGDPYSENRAIGKKIQSDADSGARRMEWDACVK
jgi:hypothetical protein